MVPSNVQVAVSPAGGSLDKLYGNELVLPSGDGLPVKIFNSRAAVVIAMTSMVAAAIMIIIFLDMRERSLVVVEQPVPVGK